MQMPRLGLGRSSAKPGNIIHAFKHADCHGSTAGRPQFQRRPYRQRSRLIRPSPTGRVAHSDRDPSNPAEDHCRRMGHRSLPVSAPIFLPALRICGGVWNRIPLTKGALSLYSQCRACLAKRPERAITRACGPRGGGPVRRSEALRDLSGYQVVMGSSILPRGGRVAVAGARMGERPTCGTAPPGSIIPHPLACVFHEAAGAKPCAPAPRWHSTLKTMNGTKP